MVEGFHRGFRSRVTLDKGYFFVKLDFQIAVVQQTRTSDRTFGGGGGGGGGGGSGPRQPTGARGTATPIFGPTLAP